MGSQVNPTRKQEKSKAKIVSYFNWIVRNKAQNLPKLCSIPISALWSICSTVPPIQAANPAAAIEEATPTSAIQPPSAAEIVAPRLYNIPIAAAVNKKVLTSLSGSSEMNSTKYFNTAGITPAAPFVGAVQTFPPAAFTSFTAIA